MKNLFLKFSLPIFLLSISLYGASPKDITLGENEVKEYEVKKENIEKNSAVNARNLILKEGATLKVTGDIDNINKTVIGLSTDMKSFKGGKLEIQNKAKLEVNVVTNKEEGLKPKNYPLIGVKTYTTKANNKLDIQKGGTLKIKVHSDKPLVPEYNTHIDNHRDKKDLFHQMGFRSIGIFLGTSLENRGNLEIESTGIGIKYDDKIFENAKLIFEDGSKTYIKAGIMAIDANKEKLSVIFKKGSYSEIIGGTYALISKDATFEDGSKVKARGKYGLGNFEYKGTGDKYTFKAGSELDILANEAALYAINIKEGSTKLNAKAHNIFMQVDTRINGNDKNLATLTLEDGSILEGNIDRSMKAKILMEKGTKIFADEKIDTNLDLKGEFFVGPRNAYENIKPRNYKEEIDSPDTIAGASVILLGKLKNQTLESLKAKLPYDNLSTDKYYTVKFNFVANNDTKTETNFNNSKVHLRLGGADSTGAVNDKLLFSKNNSIKGNTDIIFHKQNASKVTKDMIFKLFEEDIKDINGVQGYYLEKLNLSIPDIEFGSYIFTKKIEKFNNKYIISLVFKGLAKQNFLLAEGQNKTLTKKEEGSLDDAILSAKEITLEKNTTLNIKGNDNGILAKNRVSIEENANLNIDVKKDNAIGIKVEESMINSGNINIKTNGTGILVDNASSVLSFTNKSKTDIKADKIAINAKNGLSYFKSGSDTNLVANEYALISKETIIEKDAKLKLSGTYGIGTLSETDVSKLIVEPQSELQIFAKDTAIYNTNTVGSGKFYIKAPSVLKKIQTNNSGVNFLKFEEGSILEGNIEESWTANLVLDKGARIFVNNKIEANMQVKGDLFVGTKNLYEKEVVSKTMSTMSISTLVSTPLEQYTTVYYNKDSNGNKTKINFDNANIHLRIGQADNTGAFNDKIIFSKDTEIGGKGANLILHPHNLSKMEKNMSFPLLEEEEKDIAGTKGYYLEKLPLNIDNMDIGALSFTRKDSKVNGKYIIALANTGTLSRAAKNSLLYARNRYQYNQEELKGINNKIFENYNTELKNNFWLLTSKVNLKNKEDNLKIGQYSKYAGYDYTFNNKTSLGFFAGQSSGKYKNNSQGLYMKKDFKPFYLGGVFKHTNSKDGKKKLHSNDVLFIVGFNKNITPKIFLDTNIKLTRGHMSDYEYVAENNLNVKNEKFNYWNGEINTKLTYQFDSTKFFLNAALDKGLNAKQKIIWTENINENIKYDDFSKNIGAGLEYKFNSHTFNIEFSKKYSKYYKSNSKISFGYSYKF